MRFASEFIGVVIIIAIFAAGAARAVTWLVSKSNTDQPKEK